MDDMRVFGESKLQEFNGLFNKESVLESLYGSQGNTEELHARLDSLTGIVEIFC